MGAIRREMNSAKWTIGDIGYMCVFAYAISLIVYQLGLLFSGVFGFWTVAALIVLGVMVYLLLRRAPQADGARLSGKVGVR